MTRAGWRTERLERTGDEHLASMRVSHVRPGRHVARRRSRRRRGRGFRPRSGVGLSRSLDKKISRDRVGVALTLDGGVDLGGLHGRGHGHLLELRSELAGGELALGAGEHLGREGRREHGGERPRGKSSGIWTLARWGRAGMRACTRDATSRVIAGARVRGNGVTGMTLTFTGALRVTDMVATLRTDATGNAGRWYTSTSERAAGVKATAEKLVFTRQCSVKVPRHVEPSFLELNSAFNRLFN